MQIDGIAMGNPISASLCNAFLAIKEQQWLEACPPTFKPLLYKRYVDDTLLFFASEDHIDLFLHFLNSQPTPIAFTKEKENNSYIAFFDLNIYRHEFFSYNFLYLCFQKEEFHRISHQIRLLHSSFLQTEPKIHFYLQSLAS